MKTEFHSMKDELDTAKWPLDPAVIPNYMGINLCSVEGMGWTRQEDGQLVSLTIYFEPAEPCKHAVAYKDKCVGTYE